MKTTSDRLWLGWLLALIALSSGGCVDALVGEADICTFEGKGYALGEKFENDCNTCVCRADGKADCTQAECATDASLSDAGKDAGPPDGGPLDASLNSCSYDGKSYAVGDKFELSNGCGWCSCLGPEKLDCQMSPACVDAAVACHFEGINYSPGSGIVSKNGCKCLCNDDGSVSCFGESCADAGTSSSGSTCNYGGKEYGDGPFISADGCQRCTCDTKYGAVHCEGNVCADAGPPTCKYEGKELPVGTFLTGDKCDTCTCWPGGTVSCQANACQPDGGAGECTYAGKSWPIGAKFYTGIECNTCECLAADKLNCTMQPCADDAGVPTTTETCAYNGKTYKLGEGFMHADGCNKCQCVKGGTVECSIGSCMQAPSCAIGSDVFQVGQTVVCPDGCNDCACTQTGFSQTKRACPALPLITQCPTDISTAFPASLVYLQGDALAVAESRCVSGQTTDFQLCYDGLGDQGTGVTTNLYVFAGTTTRACNAAATERVFSLKPLHDALRPQNPGGGKTMLRGNGRYLVYTYGP